MSGVHQPSLVLNRHSGEIARFTTGKQRQAITDKFGQIVKFISHLVFDRAGEFRESIRTRVLIGKGGAKPGNDVLRGAKALRSAGGGRRRDGLQGTCESINGVVKEFETSIVSGANTKIHLKRGNLRGQIERFVEMLESDIEGNVDEILFVGVERTREIEERVDTESREASSTTSLGNSLSWFSREVGVGSSRGGSSESDEKGGGDSGGDDEKERKKGNKEKACSPWVGRGK